jgi:hypothetical protein
LMTLNNGECEMQHIEFPQDVNTEPYSELEALVVYGLTTSALDPLSHKQAAWLVGVARLAEWDPQGIAYALAMVRRGGPDLQPFSATDAELEADARNIFDEGVAGYLRVAGRLQ